MTEQEANEVVTLIHAATGDNWVEQKTLDYFRFALIELDYHTALDAAAIGAGIWRRFPSWGEYREFYKEQVRLREPDPDRKRREEIASSSQKHPEWVWVWSWARHQRAPRSLRSFPQQRDWVDPDTIMSDEDYERLHQEWLDAGSPKAQNPIPLARDSQN